MSFGDRWHARSRPVLTAPPNRLAVGGEDTCLGKSSYVKEGGGAAVVRPKLRYAGGRERKEQAEGGRRRTRPKQRGGCMTFFPWPSAASEYRSLSLIPPSARPPPAPPRWKKTHTPTCSIPPSGTPRGGGGGARMHTCWCTHHQIPPTNTCRSMKNHPDFPPSSPGPLHRQLIRIGKMEVRRKETKDTEYGRYFEKVLVYLRRMDVTYNLRYFKKVLNAFLNRFFSLLFFEKALVAF